MSVQQVQYAAAAAPQPEAAAILGAGRVILLLAAHVPLALLMDRVGMLATAHALLVLGFGVWAVAMSNRPDRVAAVCAYVAGSEVLWRMTSAAIPWEIGKYGTAALMLLALLRLGRLSVPALPLLYFLLLLPAVYPTAVALGAEEAREAVSFNLAGPAALFVCSWFFSQVRLTPAQLQPLLLALVAPAVGIAAIAVHSIANTAGEIQFSDSNFITSGGFGPNQVAAVLGLGALFSLLFVLTSRTSFKLRAVMLCCVAALAAQSALTFSRGGFLIFLASALTIFPLMFKSKGAAVKLLPAAGFLLLVGYFVVVPYLDAFTKGAIFERFQDTRMSRREDLIEADMQAWNDSPLYGVGVGMSKEYHEAAVNISAASHTEFSRLLAEHGMLGAAALCLILVAGLMNVARSRSPAAKAVAASCVCWSLLFMFANATRLVAPSFVFGLVFSLSMLEWRPHGHAAEGQ